MHDIELEENPRPLKRQRQNPSSSPSASSTPSQPFSATNLLPIPPPHLLLALPPLLIHPPTHNYHIKGLLLSRHALQRCLALPESQLDRNVECRAWTALAEIGVQCLTFGTISGLRDLQDAIETEVEKALTKALLISQKHPSLRSYYPHLTILSSRLSHHQQNNKFAHHTLRRLLTTFIVPASDPPHIIYGAHLALIDSYMTSVSASTIPLSLPNNTPTKARTGTRKPSLLVTKGANELPKTLVAIQDMHDIAQTRGDISMVLLTLLVRVLVLVRHGVWAQVGNALTEAERAFAQNCPPDLDPVTAGNASPGSGSGSPTPAIASTATSPGGASTLSRSNTSNEATTDIHAKTRRTHLVLLVHLLIASVVYHTYTGNSPTASESLKRLHALLDAGVLSSKSGGRNDGLLEIPLPKGQNLHIMTTHPRILYVFAFLLSAVAKRDAVGRKPKKGVFAKEGLGILEREGWGDVLVSGGGDSEGEQQGQVEFGMTGSEAREISLPVYASIQDLDAVKRKMAKIKTELLCEVITISIMRSEFDTAHNTLNTLIAHTRTHDLFSLYAARITLLQAQLAHAVGRTDRALKCYQVAAFLASGGGDDGCEDEWVRVAARAGEIWVRIGVVRGRIMRMRTRTKDIVGGRAWELERERERKETDAELQSLRSLSSVVCAECDALGGSLSSIAYVLRACLVNDKEYVSAKQHLRKALDLTTKAGDTHLQALVLALIAAQYTCTAREHAESMLVTCEQLAAGLGTGDKTKKTEEKENIKSGQVKGEVGNARLRLWVGERFLELHRWAGDVAKVEKQVRVNERLREAVRGVERWGSRLEMGGELCQ